MTIKTKKAVFKNELLTDTMMNKTAKFKKTLIAATLMTALTTTYVQADNTNGHIAGQTLGTNGTIVQAVEISIINVNTGLSRTITSDEEGKYRFPLLPVGTYTVHGSKDGYMVVEKKNVKVSIGGKTLLDLAMNEEGLEHIEIRGSSVALIDTTNTESGIVVTTADLERIPVPQSMSAVALLAPGTTKGDSGFGDLVSFGGSSVAENAYYINGLNVTNSRNGLSYSKVPWEMYDSFEVKTGGFSAEFGRAVGVINATTKSGGNEFKAGASINYIPDALREKRPDVLRTKEGREFYSSEYYRINHASTQEKTEVSLWASGPIIKDTLFFYGIYNPRFVESEGAGVWHYGKTESDDAFWGGKLDWQITDNHKLDVTVFSDSQTYESSIRPYDLANRVIGQYYFDPTPDDGIDNGRIVHPIQGTYEGASYSESGGQNYAIKYTGYITEDLSISAMFGHNKSEKSSRPLTNADKSSIIDARTGITVYGPTVGAIVESMDSRDQFRIDFDYYLNDHSLSFGIDIEELQVDDRTVNTGFGTVIIQFSPNELMDYLEGGELKYTDSEYATLNTYTNDGSFESSSYALYLQDEWQVTDNVILNLGLRYDEFENKNAVDRAYVKMDGQFAPRLGLSWDVNGDGESKFTANYGRYYLPIATNTNVRLAGSELNQRTRYILDGLDTTIFERIKDLDSKPPTIYADGNLKDTRELIDSSIEPMYQEELMIAYQQSLGEYVWGVRGTYRWLGATIEDVAIDKGFADYLKDNGMQCPTEVCSGFNYYVLTNPGSDLTLSTDPDNFEQVNADGSITKVEGPLPFQEWTIPSQYLGFPEAERNYISWDFEIKRTWQKDWSMSTVYTWAHSWGNSEGLVNSDIEQRDSGITQSFDQPGLMDHSSGDLANDRRHTIKVNGAYAITDELMIGFNATWQTGRPSNCLGYHPTDAYASQYGAFAFYCLEVDPESEEMTNPDYISVPSPRGSRGRTPNTFNVDMNLSYSTQLWGLDTRAQIQVFNVFNNITTTQYHESGEVFKGLSGNKETGQINPDYGLVNSTTTPRYVQFKVSVKF